MSDTIIIAALVLVGFLQILVFITLSKKRRPDESLGDRLDAGQRLMVESLQKQSVESNRIVADITRQLTEIKEGNKQVVSLTEDLKVIQNILQNPKQRGVLGEYFLQNVLENVLPPDRFKMQHRFKDGTAVDAVVFLDKDKILPIDSKFSLENYNRFIEAKSKGEKEELLKLFKSDLKNRIDETSKYIRPDENTMDFAMMFIPSEAIYYDLLGNTVGVDINARSLIEYAFKDKRVIIVSPTSFLAYLQTVMQGLRSLQIEEKAKEIQANVLKLSRHVASYDEYMAKLGKALGVTVSHFNSAHRELKKVDHDISKITGGTTNVEPLMLDSPED